jgi:glutamine cyclotransferase
MMLRWPTEMLAQEAASLRAPLRSYRLLACHPHDPQAFTQGLVYRDGQLLESTGLNGRSSLRRVRLETGDVLQRKDVARRYFAEGLAALGGELYQLTWESGVAFVYDAATFDLKRTVRYRGEGWGLTTDGTNLILSDGSDTLSFLDPGTFRVRSRVSVRDGDRRVERLNELEFVGGKILANVWLTDRIAIIDPVSGQVTGWLDLTGLGPASQMTNAVLNGIAYDRDGDRLFVTGKLWPVLFEIQVLWEDSGTYRPREALPGGPERGCR